MVLGIDSYHCINCGRHKRHVSIGVIPIETKEGCDRVLCLDCLFKMLSK